MDFKSLLSQLDQLNEAETKTTDTGRVHKGDYGTSHGKEDVRDQYGHKIGKVNKDVKAKKEEPKKGRGRPTKASQASGEDKKYDFTALSGDKKDVKLKPYDKKKTTKHSIKEYIDQLESALNEAEQIQIKPASQMPKTPSQTAGSTSLPGQPQGVQGQAPKNTQVIAQGNKTLGTVDNPQLAQQIKQSIGKGEMTLMPHEDMAEDGSYSAKAARAGKDIGKPGKAFAKIAKSAGERYGSKAAGERVAGAVLNKLRHKTNEADLPPHDSLASPLSMEESKKAKPDFLDMDKDGNKKESMKKAVADKKKKVEEGMNENLLAARLKGKHDGLKGHSHCGKTYDDMEEARCYHEGYKEGLDECYGQMPIAGGSAMGENSTVNDMASFGAHTPEVDEGNAFTAALKNTPKGGKFSVGGKTFTDHSSLEESPFAFESLEQQLNALLESKEDVAEGMTVSISKGQQGAPDSVSVSAQDGEADQLLSLIKSAGLGLFGGEEQNGYGAPQGSTQAPGGIEVVDDHDGMMALMKKLTGQGGDEGGSADYADEEGSDEGHEHTDEEACNECGMAYESCGCDHEDKEMVDEVESEDQMTYNVAEDNPPDSGAADTDAEIADTNQANAAAASYDQAEAGEEAASDAAGDEDEEETVEESLANGDDDTFEADIDFMTNVISGGLNKRKATGQTTIPVVGTQLNRMHSHDTSDINESVNDWKKLAGIK
jgi:hypothetical protein